MPSPAALAAVKRRDSLGRQSVVMPIWIVDGKPLKVFWGPMTVGEASKFAEYRGNPEGDVYILIEKALNEDGTKVFTIEDKHLLLYDSCWQDVSSLAVLMCALPTVKAVDDAEKKSGAIQT